MISGNKKDLFATCKCGCQEGVQFHISHEGDEDYFLQMVISIVTSMECLAH